MSNDEAAIRDLVRKWHEASRAGDVATVLGLMTDDVVFLVVGREPFGKQEFAALSTPPPGGQRPVVDAQQRIEEIHVAGTVAYMRSHFHIRVTPHGGALVQRAGPALSVFRKVGGQWLLARDANLLSELKA